MLGLKQYKGEWYHYNTIEKKFILEEDGSKIPSYRCLCFAHTHSECCCGCVSWTEDDYND